MTKNLLKRNSVVNRTPTGEKRTLVKGDTILENWQETINQSFSQDFIKHITKSNRPKIFKLVGLGTFGIRQMKALAIPSGKT